MATSNKLKDYYKLTGRSLYDIARVTGISRPTLMRLMSGQAKDVWFSKAVAIKKVTGLDVHEYVPGSNPKARIVLK